MARAEALTLDEIVAVATRLLRAHGVDWFSMRKLARELDVNPMTVYLRVENKEQLLDLVVAGILSEIELPDLGADAGPWTERAFAFAAAVRAHLLANRELLPLLGRGDRMSMALFRAADAGLELMGEAGYEDAEAVTAFRALFWHTLGLTMVSESIGERYPNDQTPGEQFRAALADMPDESLPTLIRFLPHFTSFDGDQLFDYVTRLLVAGLAAASPVPTP